MYSQYYPSTPTPGTYTNPTPGSPSGPGRLKPAAQAQPQQQIDEQGQYYPSSGPRADRAASTEADALDERKPPARTGVKRPLEETHAGPSDAYPPRPGIPSHLLEGSNMPPHAAAARSAREGTYNPAEYGGQSAPGIAPGASSAKPSGEGGNAPTDQASRPVPKPEEGGGGGDGINEQQLLQDFFQHF